jgi:hypothetical protein
MARKLAISEAFWDSRRVSIRDSLIASRRLSMRPGKQDWTGEHDLFRARLDQIINLKHELVRLAQTIDWSWIDAELAGCFSEEGRPGLPTRFMVGLLLLKQIYGLSDEQVCERWVYDPYFQYFTGAEFFAHEFPHERSGISHWRKRIGGKLDALLAETLRVAHASGALKPQDLARITGSASCARPATAGSAPGSFRRFLPLCVRRDRAADGCATAGPPPHLESGAAGLSSGK